MLRGEVGRGERAGVAVAGVVDDDVDVDAAALDRFV
jgi:hypothetical protein